MDFRGVYRFHGVRRAGYPVYFERVIFVCFKNTACILCANFCAVVLSFNVDWRVCVNTFNVGDNNEKGLE